MSEPIRDAQLAVIPADSADNSRGGWIAWKKVIFGWIPPRAPPLVYISIPLCDHPCCVCPHTLLKSYAGCLILSMWFLVNDRWKKRNRDILASRQAFVGTWNTRLKIWTVPAKLGRLDTLYYDEWWMTGECFGWRWIIDIKQRVRMTFQIIISSLVCCLLLRMTAAALTGKWQLKIICR